MTTTRLLVAALSAPAILLAGCQFFGQESHPTGPSGEPGASPAPETPGPSSAPRSPPPNPDLLKIPGPLGRVQGPYPSISAPPAAVSPAQRDSAQRMVQHIVDLLESGKEDAAVAELHQLLAVDPGNRNGLYLQRQITADPVAMLGPESVPYTIKPGDSMSVLAKRFVGDSMAFYILARYNDIKVPRQLTVGQTIKVPGKPPMIPEPSAAETTAAAPPGSRAPGVAGAPGFPAPAAPGAVAPGVAALPGRPMLPSTPAAQELPAAAPNPPPASPVAIAPPVPVPPPLMQTPFDKAYQEGLRAEKNGDNEKAFAAYRQAAQLDPNNVDAKERLEQVRRKLVSSYTYAARTAFAKQDLDSAIHNWEQVLVIDPANETAKLERQKTITLREKLQGIPTSSH